MKIENYPNSFSQSGRTSSVLPTNEPTSSSPTDSRPFALKEQLFEALLRGQYETVLDLLDQLDESYGLMLLNELDEFCMPCSYNLSILPLKALCLHMLGKHNEALLLLNQVLNEEEIENNVKEWMERVVDDCKNRGLSQKKIDSIFAHLGTIWDEQMHKRLIQSTQPILLLRGFIEWSLNQKEQAIVDFQNTAKTTNIDKIFFFKLLEKKLGVRLLPLEPTPSSSDSSDATFTLETYILQGKYENAIDFLSNESYEAHDQIALCYVLMGQYEEAQKCFEKIDLSTTSDREDYLPIPAILHFLNGDLEHARQELSRTQYLNLLLLFNLPA
jgi:tetratricopeptide (TPR) repeat protein